MPLLFFPPSLDLLPQLRRVSRTVLVNSFHALLLPYNVFTRHYTLSLPVYLFLLNDTPEARQMQKFNTAWNLAAIPFQLRVNNHILISDG